MIIQSNLRNMPTEVHQYYWASIETVSFYNSAYPVLNPEYLVAIFKIKWKW